MESGLSGGEGEVGGGEGGGVFFERFGACEGGVGGEAEGGWGEEEGEEEDEEVH